MPFSFDTMTPQQRKLAAELFAWIDSNKGSASNAEAATKIRQFAAQLDLSDEEKRYLNRRLKKELGEEATTERELVEQAAQYITRLHESKLDDVVLKVRDLCWQLPPSEAVQVASSILHSVSRRPSCTAELRDQLIKQSRTLDKIADQW